MTNFQIKAIDKNVFSNIFELNEQQLHEIGARKMVADEFPGFPCRISLQDTPIGEGVVLLPYQHHKTSSPYRASGPIFIRQNAQNVFFEINEIPKMFAHRLLSLRGFDVNGMMLEATVTEGVNLRAALQNIFENLEISYIHIHNAKPGCYNCLVVRA
jgi:hypothetical protein